MLKNPFDAIVHYVKENLETSKKTNEFIYTQTDSLITWLVGFAFAAISLITANISSIKTNLHSNAKPVIFFLFVTIILGLVFRYVSYLVMVFQKNLDSYFMGVFGDIDMMPTEPDEDLENESYEGISKRLKNDFDEVINYPRNLSEKEKETELPKMINHYKELCKYSQKQFEITIKHIAEINETAYKIDKAETIALFRGGLKNPKIGYDLKFWNRIKTLLYTLCISSFTTAVSIVSIYLLCS